MNEDNFPDSVIGASDTFDVTVSYLELERDEGQDIMDDLFDVVEVLHPDVPFYRFLYGTVGQQWIWWRRRLLSDADLKAILSAETTRLYVFYREGKPYGFFELDTEKIEAVDIAYFGLMPFAIGNGFGTSALRSAIRTAKSFSRRVTVTTCSADHHRALNTYVKSGFSLKRTEKETWTIPRALGFDIPSILFEA